jgi:DNA topoisomerase-3
MCPGGEGKPDASPCKGMMVLDVNSKPNWKMACNQCNLLIKFTGTLHNIKVLYKEHDECEECGASKIEVEFHKDKSPLKDGSTTYQGCVLCDNFLNNLTEMKMGRMKHITLTKSKGRGRGKGRRGGRGGRGRRMKGGLLAPEDF